MAPARAAPRLVGCSCGELERTRLGPQARRKTIRQFSNLYVVGGKNRTCIGPHLGAIRRAEIPVISDVKVGYVRRSELNRVLARTIRCWEERGGDLLVFPAPSFVKTTSAGRCYVARRVVADVRAGDREYLGAVRGAHGLAAARGDAVLDQ